LITKTYFITDSLKTDKHRPSKIVKNFKG